MDWTLSFRVISYHMPTYPQVFHKDLFVTPLEKGILEYQQSLSKGKVTILKNCTCSAKIKWFSSQPTRHRTLFPKPLTTNCFILNFSFYGESPRSNNIGNASADLATSPSATMPVVELRGQQKASWSPICRGAPDPAVVSRIWWLCNRGRFPERLQNSWRNFLSCPKSFWSLHLWRC